MKLWRRLDSDARHITTLRCVVASLILVIAWLGWGWHTTSQDLTIHIPPDVSSGVTMKVSDIPSASVYAFSFYLWQELENWQVNGAEDFKKNLSEYRNYLTPSFSTELHQQLQALAAKGQLQDRTRVVQGEVGAAFDANNVTALGNGTWEVDLVVRVTERIGNTILQDSLVKYPLRVIRYDINRRDNPWGMAIDGFVSDPVRLKNFYLR